MRATEVLPLCLGRWSSSHAPVRYVLGAAWVYHSASRVQAGVLDAPVKQPDYLNRL